MSVEDDYDIGNVRIDGAGPCNATSVGATPIRRVSIQSDPMTIFERTVLILNLDEPKACVCKAFVEKHF